MRGLTAAHGKNTLRKFHALDILGAGLQADENDLFALLALDNGVLGGKYDLTRRCARRRRNARADDVVLVRGFERGGVERRVQKHIERLRVDLHERFLFGNHLLVDEVAGDFDSGGGGALAVTGLQHIEFLVLYGKLHILHIAVVIFEGFANLLELRERLGEYVFHLRDRHGGANARNNVFALSVHEELAHKTLFAGCGIAGERNAGTRIVAHVAERHHLHVNGSAPAVRNIVVHAVDVRTGVVPRTEHRFDCAEKLLFGVGGEILADFVLVFGFELRSEFFEVVGGELNVLRNALLLFHFVDKLFEIFLAYLHYHVGIHLYETAIAVPSPAGVARLFGYNLNHLFVKTEVENGVHHAGHACACARANRNQKRVFLIAEFFADKFLELVYVFHDFGLYIFIDLLAVLVILGASLG